MSIDVLNANCGLGSIPGPRPPQGRVANVPRGDFSARLLRRRTRERPSRSRQHGTMRDDRDQNPARRRRVDLEEANGWRLKGGNRGARRRAAPTASAERKNSPGPYFRPEVGRGYPLNLSILLSGGKETNEDSLSNGE